MGLPAASSLFYIHVVLHEGHILQLRRRAWAVRTLPSVQSTTSPHTNNHPIDFHSQRSLEGFFGDCGLPEKFTWAEGDWSYTIEERMTEEEREELRRQEESGYY